MTNPVLARQLSGAARHAGAPGPARTLLDAVPMNRLAVFTATLAALGALACSSETGIDTPVVPDEGALVNGERAVCTPLDPEEALVDDGTDVFRVKSITFTMREDEIDLRVERETESGRALQPIREFTPDFVHTDRSIRASLKRDVLLRATKSSSSGSYSGFVTVKSHTFSVECSVSTRRPAATCRDGQSRPDVDGCNTCHCSGGRWACTELFCGTPRRPPGRVTRNCTEGETRAAPDGCNSCSCLLGEWSCTELACAPRPRSGDRSNGTGSSSRCTEGTSVPAGDGCNTCYCRNGYFGCTELFCGR